MEQASDTPQYRAMTLADLASLLTGADQSAQWRLLAEFLEEYRWEPVDGRQRLLADEPPGTGDERWDVLLAALAEHLAAYDGRGAPTWSEPRRLRRFWFPFNTPAARVDALVHARPRSAVGASSSPRTSWRWRERGSAATGPPRDRGRVPAAWRSTGRQGVVADVYVFGGAAMALAYDARRATRDIDAIFEPHGIVMEEARGVAKELGLPDWWLNEQASAYVAPGGDPSAPRVFDHPGLRVSAASPEHLLAMKVLAARRRDGDDIRFLVRRLGLTSVEQVLAVCAEVFPDEPVPDRARLVLEDTVQCGDQGQDS